MGDMVSVGQMAQSAWQGVRYLKSMINSELHVADFTGFVAPTTAGDGVALSALAQGDGIQDRSGNSVLAKKVYIRASLQLHASATRSAFRVAIVRDEQQVGDSTPPYEQCFSPGGGVLSALNSANIGRFSILYDRTYVVDSDTPLKMVEVTVPLNHHLRFNGGASTDIQKGGVYMLVCSSEATNCPTFTYRARLMYHDN